MKQQMKRSLLLCAVVALACGGCAKTQAVKPEEAIAPVASKPAVAPAPAAKTAVTAAPEAKHAALPASSISEAQAKEQSQPAKANQSEKSLQPALDKIFFDFDSYTLSSEARDALAKNAAILKERGKATIRIEGHCDELGSDDYNLALGEKRASAALNYFKSLGIAADRLSVISYGKEKPADSGHDDAARAKNRRDEFVITSN